MLYFAYGSNMSSAQMAARCPGSITVSPACLRGYALLFDRYSERWQGHVADIVARAGVDTWGVLWQVNDEHLEQLDRFEGVASGAYARIEVHVHTESGESHGAVAYQVVFPAAQGIPSPAYAATILSGAREHALPAGYIASLERIARSAAQSPRPA